MRTGFWDRQGQTLRVAAKKCKWLNVVSSSHAVSLDVE